ncbi:alpha-protein kinase 3 isoform X2 [Erpetoichthys calabaricus]|uniref:alpha-protein kinase 3 isoform X2 n=1 Tax=Erpetoichthys calabaricus TaxID=27687 RepID=UPI0022347DDD|nr:alpha-protein kinase 3 isoform X2 [Erpetoichthys calabaricus]
MGSRRPMTRSFSGNARYSFNSSNSQNGEEPPPPPPPSARPDSCNYLLNVRPENSYSSHRYLHYKSLRSTFCSVMAQLTEETQPTFETTLKSKAVSEDCNVKFSCVVSGHPEPELTWYKDDVEMDRYCGLPKYEIFRNGKVHTLHIYNCTEDDAAIYQASARNSKGIVSCSGVLEVATMTEYKIHQRWFAKLKQKAAVKMKELEESRKRGKENVIEIHEQLRTTSPERVQRKRRSPGEANILSPASLQSRNDAVKTNIPDTESRLQEDASDVKESASDVPNGFLAGSKESHDDSISEEVMLENGNDFLTYIYETVEIVTKRPASKEFLAKKKKKISNQVDGGQGTEEGEKRSNEEHAKSNESMSLAQYLAESLMSQIPEGKEKTVESSDLMDETPVLITQSSRISEQSNNIQTTLHKETEFPKSPPATSPGYFSLRDIFFGNKEDSFLSVLESEENKASNVKEMPPQITSIPTTFEKINSSNTVNSEIKSQIEERSMMETENTTAIDNIHTGAADSIPRWQDNKMSANEQSLTLDSFQSSANEVLVCHKPEEKSLLSFMEREEEEEESGSKQNVLQQERFKQADMSEVGHVEKHEDIKKTGSPEDDKNTLLVLKSDRLAVESSEETFQVLDVSNDVTFQEESEQKSSEQTNEILKLLIEPQHTSHEFPVQFRGNSNTTPVILDEKFNHTDRVECEISTNIEKTENQTITEHLGIVKESYVDLQNDTISSAEDDIMITPNKVHTVIPLQNETKLISDIIEPPMKLFDIPVSCPETMHIFQLNTGNMQDECRNVPELLILQTEENALSKVNEAQKITQSFPEKTIVEKENIGILDHQTVVRSGPDQNCYSATLSNVEPLIPQEELPDMMTKDHEVSEEDNTFKQQKPFTDSILPQQQDAMKVPLISKTVSSENIAQSSNILTAVDKDLPLDVSPAVGNKPHENIYSVMEMPSVETEDLFINHNESLVEVLRSVKKDLENSQIVETLPLDTNKDGVEIMPSNNENILDNNFFSPPTEAVAETSKKVLLSEADKLAVSTDMYVILDGKPNIPDDNLSIKGLKNEETISITQSTQSIHIPKLKESTQAPSEYNILQKKEKDPKSAPAVLIESSISANTVIADVLGLSSVPSIRVDDTLFKEVYNQQEASPQTEKKDKPLTQHSSENSPKLKHNEILPLIPSATPEELASGARRKIFISKSKGDELDGTILDNQVKKEELSKRRQLSQDLESPCASPGQSRRGLTFLQPPMAPHTTPVEKCSPKLNRKVSTLEVPKLYEDTNVKNESNKDFKTDIKAEDMKKQQDPFKAPQVIRKIRGEQFSDTSGHLKLWCQFFNILSESTIMWYRDDVPVAEVRRSSGDEDQVALAIVQASSKDCGVYTCAINNEYGYDSTDYLLSAEILSEFIVREEVEVGEEIEMTTMLFTKGLADSGSWGEKLFGRIMTVEACVGSGWKRKLCKVKVIYGLDPVFESSTTCIIKIRNPIAYGTKKEIGLIEKNQEISKQECKIQNTAREYCKIFAAEARLISNFGAVPEIIPLHLIYRPANSIPYATVEVDLEGSFVTYSIMDNMGNIVSRNTSEEDQKCCAFQHWIYQWTNGNLLVTELEGVGLKLTNVGITTKSKGYQGFTNNYCAHLLEQFPSLHQCNYYCGLLGLRNLKNTEVQLQGKIKGSRSPLLNRKAGSGSSSPQTQKKGMISPQAPRKGPVSPKVIKKSDSGDTKSTVSHKTVEIPKSVRMR